MGILKDIFFPSQEEIWKKLCAEINADLVNKGFLLGHKVVAKSKEWIITLDTYDDSVGETSTYYTRMRAPYINKDGFRFKIYRKGFFSNLGKLLGMQDIEIGIPSFDEKFIIEGNNKPKLQELFSNPKIRELIELQPHISLEVKDDEGWFSTQFPDGVDELCFKVKGIIKDIERLKNLYYLFAEVLNQLCIIGSAYKDKPKIDLY